MAVNILLDDNILEKLDIIKEKIPLENISYEELVYSCIAFAHNELNISVMSNHIDLLTPNKIVRGNSKATPYRRKETKTSILP